MPNLHLSLRNPVRRGCRRFTQWSLLLTTIASGVVHADAALDDFPLIPFGAVAKAEANAIVQASAVADAGIVEAWYSCATQRYRHGVLGDDTEAGCLLARDHDGRLYQYMLDEQFVFEDNVPRLADIDGDGNNDVISIRADRSRGAALVVYGIDAGAAASEAHALRVLAETPAIGTANRWLAPAGIADFNDDGKTDIAYVQTPHIGGILRLWSWLDQGFTEVATARGFSNHRIGDPRVTVSRVLDADEDGVADLALPDQRRRRTLIVTFTPELDILEQRDFSLHFFNR